MATFNKKTWYNAGETQANDTNSVLNKTTMNDLEQRIYNTFDDLYYKTGDTYNINSEIICTGFITSGKTNIRWSFITEKRLDNVKTVEVRHIKSSIRHADGAYITEEGGTPVDLTELGTISCSIRGKNVLAFSFTLNEAKTQYSNNSTIAVSIAELGLTFN